MHNTFIQVVGSRGAILKQYPCSHDATTAGAVQSLLRETCARAQAEGLDPALITGLRIPRILRKPGCAPGYRTYSAPRVRRGA